VYERTYNYELENARSLTISEFIEKIKTDDDFARVWGELGPIYGNNGELECQIWFWSNY
jgi:hypothetical protein